MFLRFIQSNNLKRILFFALIIFLPTQLGKHFWPPFSFISGIRVDYLSPTVYTTDILAALFILLSIKAIKLPKVLFVIFLVIAIGIFFSASPLAGWYIFAKFLEFVLLGFAIVPFFSLERDRILTGVFLGIGVVWESILGLFQFLNHGSLGGPLYLLGERTFSSSTPGIANASINGGLILRPYGTLPHPNVLAGFLLISLLLSIGLLGKQKNNWTRVFLAGVCIVGCFGLLLTLSRVAIVVALAIGIFFLLSMVKGKRSSNVVGIFLGLTVLVVITLSFFPMLGERFLFSLTDESIVQRQQLLVAAIKMISTHPIFGVGFGNFSTNALQNLPKTNFFLLLQPVHNVFLLLSAEGGLLFLSFVLWFLFKTIRQLWRLLQTDRWNASLLLAALCAIFIIGQTDHYFITLQQGQLLTTLMLSISWNAIFSVRPRT